MFDSCEALRSGVKPLEQRGLVTILGDEVASLQGPRGIFGVRRVYAALDFDAGASEMRAEGSQT